MTSGPARHALRAVALLFVAFIIWRVYASVAPDLAKLSWADITKWRPAMAPLALSFVVLVATQFFHAFLWRRIAVDIGSPAPGTRETLHIYFISSLGRYLPGKVWQIAGLATLAARFGMAAGRAAAASVIAQIMFVLTGLLLLGAALPRLGEFLPPGHSGHILRRIHPLGLSALMIAGITAAVWLVAATSLGQGIRNTLLKLAGPALGARLGNSVSVAEVITVRNGVVWALGYALSWGLIGVAFVLFVGAFQPLGAGQYLVTGGILAAAYLVGFLAVGIPAGIGVREAVMMGMLATIGLPSSLAVMIAASSRIWFTAAELLPILFIPLVPAVKADGGPALNGIL